MGGNDILHLTTSDPSKALWWHLSFCCTHQHDRDVDVAVVELSLHGVNDDADTLVFSFPHLDHCPNAEIVFVDLLSTLGDDVYVIDVLQAIVEVGANDPFVWSDGSTYDFTSEYSSMDYDLDLLSRL